MVILSYLDYFGIFICKDTILWGFGSSKLPRIQAIQTVQSNSGYSSTCHLVG